jgi:hypothetical protein
MFRVDLVLYHPVVCGSGVVCLLFVCAFHFGVCTIFHVLCVCVKLFVDLVVVFRGGDVVFEGAEVVIWWWWLCLAVG